MNNENENKNEPKIPVKKAVALKYEMEKDNAPIVIAKGERLTAERIIEIARERGIYIHEDAELVSLLSKVELGMEIPEVLYRAVAEVLAFVYRLNQKMKI